MSLIYPYIWRWYGADPGRSERPESKKASGSHIGCRGHVPRSGSILNPKFHRYLALSTAFGRALPRGVAYPIGIRWGVSAHAGYGIAVSAAQRGAFARKPRPGPDSELVWWGSGSEPGPLFGPPGTGGWPSTNPSRPAHRLFPVCLRVLTAASINPCMPLSGRFLPLLLALFIHSRQCHISWFVSLPHGTELVDVLYAC